MRTPEDDDVSLTLMIGGVGPAVVGGAPSVEGGAGGVVLGEVVGDFNIVPGSGGSKVDIL